MFKKSHHDIIIYEVIFSLVLVSTFACICPNQTFRKNVTFTIDGNNIKNNYFTLETKGDITKKYQYKTMLRLSTIKMPDDYFRLTLKIKQFNSLERKICHLNGLQNGRSQYEPLYSEIGDVFNGYIANYTFSTNIPEARELTLGTEINTRSEKITYVAFILGLAILPLTITEPSHLLLNSLYILTFNPYTIRFSGISYLLFTNYGFFLSFRIAIKNKLIKKSYFIYSIVSVTFGIISAAMIGLTNSVEPPSNPLFVIVGLLAIQIIYASGEISRSSNSQLSILSAFCMLFPYLSRFIAPLYFSEFAATSISSILMPISSLYGILTIVAISKFTETDEASENIIGYIARESSGSADGNTSTLQIKKIRNIGIGVTILLFLPALVYVCAVSFINGFSSLEDMSTSIEMFK